MMPTNDALSAETELAAICPNCGQAHQLPGIATMLCPRYPYQPIAVAGGCDAEPQLDIIVHTVSRPAAGWASLLTDRLAELTAPGDDYDYENDPDRIHPTRRELYDLNDPAIRR